MIPKDFIILKKNDINLDIIFVLDGEIKKVDNN
jgi:hypothetical protein